ncbi:class I SAM-dependent methyltransferase [Microbacterium esteraromaticum]|uniref:class I SAM-dependent methyltransferase n=1 Tax=Microbacterium esteraromaticum TaxID=57043 RepID=UPI00195919A3|nr:class I SAM-dependent methyltransferase [Microbacterium esteraromaticum]MBM7466754.1 putative O-methyltransferase YrrM [Microbacterium esteraromaticum]
MSAAWKALGRVRQAALALLVALAATQAIIMLTFGPLELLPLVAMCTLIGVFLIKLSSAERGSSARLISVRREVTRTQRAIADELKAHKRTVSLTREQLGLIREQAGRTNAQFEWLAERAVAADSAEELLQRSVNDVLAQIVRQSDVLEALRASGDETLSAATDRQIAALAELRGILSQQHTALQRTLESTTSITESVDAVGKKIAVAFDGGNSHSLERRIVAEVSAVASLYDQGISRRLPTFASWAMSPLSVQYIRTVAERLDSRHDIVELGSGVSTAWIASALAQMSEPPALIAIDHDPMYAETTRTYLSEIDADHVAQVVLAPLTGIDVDGTEHRWYSTQWVKSVENIGLLIVDGPPAGQSPGARYPALPLLMDRLADRATIFVDDADRPGESEVIKTWLNLPGVSRGGFVGRSLVLNFARNGDLT